MFKKITVLIFFVLGNDADARVDIQLFLLYLCSSSSRTVTVLPACSLALLTFPNWMFFEKQVQYYSLVLYQ